MENGYCPYEKRCKFAHGLEELKKNDQANCRYKTRPCGGYLHEGFCTYGNRCNFIHPHSMPSAASNRKIDIDFVAIKAHSMN
jgi:butyrate response factor 1